VFPRKLVRLPAQGVEIEIRRLGDDWLVHGLRSDFSTGCV
jgi:hypothetical protein